MSKSKSINLRRVCLFIVEGISDKIALQNILTKYFSSKKLRTCVLETDITSDENSTPSNIEQVLTDEICTWLQVSKLTKQDIYRIIQLTDLDGAFIPDSQVIYNASYKHPYYTEKDIQTAYVQNIPQRNHRKAGNINALLECSTILGIPYNLYFMSCNLDHVLYNRNNVDSSEKLTLAEEFADRFLGSEQEFIDFLKKEGVIDDATYSDSWDKVKQNGNSLQRKTNIDKAIL